MLTVLVPIKDSDATIVETLPPVDVDNINIIYKHEGVYKRLWLNPSTNQYEYREVVDREFPYLGKPLEIFDFTYDATRMGPAPTISAQSVMWYAEKDESGEDVLLDGMWTQECHVTFNGEKLYLKQIPTSGKSNEDARYRYDIDFVAARVVLEYVYFYDVVTPFASGVPVSEKAIFSFFGGIEELAKRLNASLIRSGLTSLQMRQGMSDSNVLTYEEWNEIGLGIYEGNKPIRKLRPGQGASVYFYFYQGYDGNYQSYLENEVYEIDTDGEYIMSGYIVEIGKDQKGEKCKSEEKIVTFENNTIHEALQKVKDDFGLQYYIFLDDESNTHIVIGDCEYEFAEHVAGSADTEHYGGIARNADGSALSPRSFSYGIKNELLAIEKTNTTDKIVTRCTGTGSEENIPWYYPNPTADGWIKPVYKHNGNVDDGVSINYPIDYTDKRYEKFLKNRLGDIFRYGLKTVTLTEKSYREGSFIGNNDGTLIYEFTLTGDSFISIDAATNTYEDGNLTTTITKNGQSLSESEQAVFTNGSGILGAGTYRITYQIHYTSRPVPPTTGVLYYYPEKTAVIRIANSFPYTVFRQILLGDFLGAGLLGTNISIHYPAFFSTNPNLAFRDVPGEYDYHNKGWFDVGTPSVLIDIFTSAYPKLERNQEYYVFEGGKGPYANGNAKYLKVVTMDAEMVCNVPSAANATDYQLILEYLTGDLKIYYVTPVSVKEFGDDYRYIDYFVENYFTFGLQATLTGWFRNREIKPSDITSGASEYGITLPPSLTPVIGDTVEFRRVKYVTPQPNLMPEVYIKTDGEYRFYPALNYWDEENGTLAIERNADIPIGETQVGTHVRNNIYKDKESDSDNKHYQFENVYIQTSPREHIVEFPDEKPSIKEQTNYIPLSSQPSDWSVNYNSYFVLDDENFVQNTNPTWDSDTTYYALLRIDVVEEFAFDETDNDEIWESEEGNSMEGEYKHPHFFAKLRPLGFNLFDLALQEDMVLSMTTGDCGACNFKVKVDENTKKNPVQIWEYDVYEGENSQVVKYPSGSLRRYVDTSNLYYEIDGQRVSVNGQAVLSNPSARGFIVDAVRNAATYTVPVIEASRVINGEIGSLNREGTSHFEGDVVTTGRYIESQQDTNNYVWVALEKDTSTYGVLMPSAQPNYNEGLLHRYIEPKGINHTNRSTGDTSVLTENEADKFVLLNIRMPQIYLRRAERSLSRKIVKYMYENNYQKFNFSIRFSRIFLAEDEDVLSHLNENSVIYIDYYGAHNYRQYISHYSYKMSKDAVLPEVSVDMNEELSVFRTQKQQQESESNIIINDISRRIGSAMRRERELSDRRYIGASGTHILEGNLVSRRSTTSFNNLKETGRQQELLSNNFRVFDAEVNLFNTGVDERLKQIRLTVEDRLLPVAQDVHVLDDESCQGIHKYYFTSSMGSNVKAKLWLDSDGQEQNVTGGMTCIPNQGMIDIEWVNQEIN